MDKIESFVSYSWKIFKCVLVLKVLTLCIEHIGTDHIKNTGIEVTAKVLYVWETDSSKIVVYLYDVGARSFIDHEELAKNIYISTGDSLTVVCGKRDHWSSYIIK